MFLTSYIYNTWNSLIERFHKNNNRRSSFGKNKILIRILFLALLSFAFSCSSNVRFASAGANSNSSKKASASVNKATNTKKQDIEPPKYTAKEIGDKRANIIKSAKAKYGVPYCYGGNGSTDCYDCSGFVCAVFSENGLELPRVAADQSSALTPISKAKAQAGDLVFFKDKNRISHVGIYLGEDVFIHASSSNGVMFSSLQDVYFAATLAGFGKMPNKSVEISKK